MNIGEPPCVPIPEGWFLMGCETGRDDELPVHRVWIDAFQLAACQVTNSDYGRFLRDTGASAPKHWADPDFSHPDQPVVAVSWFDADAYCKWLSASTGRPYRLPTEAEWERAARGGAGSLLYTWGNQTPLNHPAYLARWAGNITGPLPVGRDAPNPYGLLDIGENVHEWCADWYDPAYYSTSPERNPSGPEHGGRRASRGGSWRHHVKVSRCAARSSIPPEFAYADYGFRVARSI